MSWHRSRSTVESRHTSMMWLTGIIGASLFLILAALYLQELQTCKGVVLLDDFGIARCLAAGGVR